MSSNIRIIYFASFSEIRSAWTSLFNETSNSYFCSPQWHQVVSALLSQKILTKRTHKIVYFKATANKEQTVIGFFYIKTILAKRSLVFSHLVGPSDYYNLVATQTVDAVFLKNMLLQIAKEQQCFDLRFAHIRKDTALFEAISLLNQFSFSALKCAAINLADTYEQHLQRLSKNAKQNLRTANNRLSKSGAHKEFQFLNAQNANEIDFKALKVIYKQRNEHKKEAFNWKSKIYKQIDHCFQNEADIFDLQEIKKTDFMLGILKIDYKIAAYFFGLRKSSGIEINRVAINAEFRQFSPGILLLDEFIKNSFSTGIKTIDLTVGDEKYKYDLGGQTHEIFNISGTV